MRRGDDLVAGFDVERGHGEIERIGAVGAGHAVLDVHGAGEFALERIDIGSADERVVADHGGDRGVDLALDGLILKLQICEGYRHPIDLPYPRDGSRRAGLPA